MFVHEIAKRLFLFDKRPVFTVFFYETKKFVPRHLAPRRHILHDPVIIGLDLEDLSGRHLFDLVRSLENRHGTCQTDAIEHEIRLDIFAIHRADSNDN